MGEDQWIIPISGQYKFLMLHVNEVPERRDVRLFWVVRHGEVIHENPSSKQSEGQIWVAHQFLFSLNLEVTQTQCTATAGTLSACEII